MTQSESLLLRQPEKVMRLERLGSMHQTRLSFMRVLLRRLRRDGWRFDRPVWRMDHRGTGLATYRAIGPERTYTLVCFAHDLPDHLRSDRVIAEAWDATFTLFDGDPTEDDLDRLAAQVPLQEAGRLSEREVVLSRANRSVRLFDHVVDCLAHGRQPEPGPIERTGYLMRTTAVYGGGKFGLADRAQWARRAEFSGSFQPELLSVWLIRAFTVDLVEHLARCRGGAAAVALDPHVKRRLGVGNSTGLGMAPFLVNHPLLFNNWILARERAFARVVAQGSLTAEALTKLRGLVAKSQRNVANWVSSHPVQVSKLAELGRDLDRLATHLAAANRAGELRWDSLYAWAEAELSLEGQELLVSLAIELHPGLCDELAARMQADETEHFRIDGAMRVGELRGLIETHYGWALGIDFDRPEANARVWYVSAEKLEPRLGERFEEDLDAYEQALAPGRDVHRLYHVLSGIDPDVSVAEVLRRHDECRHAVRRVQLIRHAPYGEIRDNTIGEEMLPIDLLRCKLSFFGATRFDPRSDRWVRITMYQGAPFPDELAEHDPDEMVYPVQSVCAVSNHGDGAAHATA